MIKEFCDWCNEENKTMYGLKVIQWEIKKDRICSSCYAKARKCIHSLKKELGK